MGIAAAVGATAVAGIAGAALTSSASQSAANTEANAADAATAASQQEAAQTQATLAPYNTAGVGATADLQASLGLGGSGTNLLAANGINSLTFQPTEAQLEATPGYQFDLQQGQQAVANSNAAQGTGISGAALKGAANYATGLANNTLTTQDSIFQNNLNNVLSPLSNLSNLGENAAAQTGQLGTQNTANANTSTMAAGADEAAGTVGSTNALTTGLTTAASAPLNYALYSSLLGGSGEGSAALPGGTF